MKTHHIDISEKTIKKTIKNCLSDKVVNKEQMLDLFYYFINTRSDGVDVFLSVYLGAYAKPKYKLDDIVWIDTSVLYFGGSICDEGSKQRGYSDGNSFKAKIISVDEYSKYQYKVEITYWGRDNEEKQSNHWVGENSVMDLIEPAVSHINLGDLM